MSKVACRQRGAKLFAYQQWKRMVSFCLLTLFGLESFWISLPLLRYCWSKFHFRFLPLAIEVEEEQPQKGWQNGTNFPAEEGHSSGLLIKLLLVAVWLCSFFIRSWNRSWKRCWSAGISSLRVHLPTSVRYLEKRRCRHKFRHMLAFPRNTRASSSIPLTRSGSGPSSSFVGLSSTVRAAKIGRAVSKKGPLLLC